LGKTLKLDAQMIQEEEPGELAGKASELVFSAVGKLKGDPEATVLSLPQHWRAIYTVWLLDGEVKNGGLHRFFWNTDGKFNDATLADLKFIGAVAHEQLFAKALAEYGKYDYAKEKKKAGKNLEGFTAGYKEKRYEGMDDQFYKIKPEIDVVLGEFIKQRPELYTGGTK